MTNAEAPNKATDSKDARASGDDCGCRGREPLRTLIEELLMKPIGRAFDVADAASSLASDLPGVKTVKDAVCSHPATPHFRRAALEILEGARIAINSAFDRIEAYEKTVASNAGADAKPADSSKQTEG